MVDKSKFKALLEQSYKWPCNYMFKFVVLETHADLIFSIIPNGVLIGRKSSKNGKYVSLSIMLKASCSEEILEIYDKARELDGVISL